MNAAVLDRADATAMIAEAGQAVTLTRRSTGAYDPSTSAAAVTEARTQTTGVLLPMPRLTAMGFAAMSGSNVVNGDQLLYLSAVGAGGAVVVQPGVSDTVAIGGVDYSIVQVSPLAPAGIAIFYECIVRGSNAALSLEPLVTSDFKNGTYLLGGNPVAVTDLWQSGPNAHANQFDPNSTAIGAGHIVPGVGFTVEKAISYNTDNPATMTPQAMAALGDFVANGVTVVFEYETQSNGLWAELECTLYNGGGELPYTGWSFNLFNGIRQIWDQHGTNTPEEPNSDGRHRVAINYSASQMAYSFDGGPVEAIPVVAPFNPDHVMVSIASSGFQPGHATGTCTTTVSKVSYYPLRSVEDLPSLAQPTPLAVADFKGNTFMLDGAASTYAAVMGAARYVPGDEARIFPGTGWATINGRNEVMGVSDALLAKLDIAGAGCTVVITQWVRTALLSTDKLPAINVTAGDFPDWAFGFLGICEAVDATTTKFEMNNFVGFDDTDVIAQASVKKYGMTLSNGLVAHAFDGTLLGSDTTDAAVPAGPTFLDFSTFSADYASTDDLVIIEKIEFYPAQDNSALAALTA